MNEVGFLSQTQDKTFPSPPDVAGPFEEKYASWRHRSRWDATLVWRVRHHLDPRPGDALVDVGCGTGYLCSALERIGVVCVGVDRSPTGTRVLAERGGSAVLGEMLLLPFTDDSFQFTVSSHMLEYTKDPAALLAEVRRVLRPGGRAYVLVSRQPERVILPLRPVVRHFDRVGQRQAHLDVDELIAAAREAGLDPVASGMSGHLIMVVAAVIHRITSLVSRDVADGFLFPLLALDDRLAGLAGGGVDVWAVVQRPLKGRQDADDTR